MKGENETTMNEDSFKWATDADIIDFHKYYMGGESHNILECLKDYRSKQNSFTIKEDKDSSGVSEKDWEIVVVELDGKYYGSGKDEYVIEAINEFIERGAIVYSVKRLSDNSIWSVGDKDDKDGVIKGFHFNVRSTILFAILEYKHKTHYGVEIKDLKKAKQPLFKTEDGKDVFEGDSVFWINTSYESYWGVYKEDALMCFDKSYIVKYFSTEAAAKEYAVNNKPVLSLKDILSCKYPYPIFNFNKEGKDYKILDEQKLRELVEKRINK